LRGCSTEALPPPPPPLLLGEQHPKTSSDVVVADYAVARAEGGELQISHKF
jgi:hypothetical protein